MVCSVEVCDRPLKSAGYCGGHYHRSRVPGADMTTELSPRRPKGETLARNADGEKMCSRCGAWRPVSDFTVQTGKCQTLDGLRTSCRLCDKTRQAELQLMRLYGLTVEAKDALLEKQGFGCAICAAPITDCYHVDHDHDCCPVGASCGECVRGLLCLSCNVGLGHFGDSVERMQSAIQYLMEKRADN